jgi:hypothetical protein
MGEFKPGFLSGSLIFGHDTELIDRRHAWVGDVGDLNAVVEVPVGYGSLSLQGSPAGLRRLAQALVFAAVRAEQALAAWQLAAPLAAPVITQPEADDPGPGGVPPRPAGPAPELPVNDSADPDPRWQQ